LIVVLVLGQQNAFLRQAGGQGHDAVVVLDSGAQSGVSAVRLRQALANHSDLMQVSGIDHLPWSSYTNLAVLAGTKDPLASDVISMVTGVGFGYFEVFDAKVLAGRIYDQARDRVPQPAGSPPVPSITPVPAVIDRSMVSKLGFASPEATVGHLIYTGPSAVKAGFPQQAYEVIGVVDDMPQNFLGAGAAGGVYALGDGTPFHLPIIRLAHGREKEALAMLRNVWSGLTTRPFAPLYVSELFERGFQRYDQTSRLFQGLSFLAFLISAAGLFGMAVHVIQRRRHEIGVRKTLGSTALRVVVLLIRDFSKPVVIANVLVWPIAYVAVQTYLSSFMRRIDLTLAPFVLSFAITLGIAWIVVGAQTLRAATLRPADVLRYG
jgi:putative ABC transport system permease protein